MYYRDDREFTDEQHKTNATPYIYDKLGWKEKNIEEELNGLRDTFSAIDYEFVDKRGNKIFVQERFRKNRYSKNNDFTIRYERPENDDVLEQKSEFYKIRRHLNRHSEPFYLVYAFEPSKGEPLKKYVIVNLRALFKHIENEEICIIDGNENITNKCRVKVYINENSDKSSTFACFNVNQIMSNFDDVIIWQIGFNGE